MRSIAGAGDVDGDGRADVIVGDTGAARGRGGAYVVRGGRGGRLNVRRLGRRGFVIAGRERASAAGWSVAGGLDFNGDHRADVALTAPQDRRDRAGRAAGGAWVVFGRRRTGTLELARLGKAGLDLRGPPASWTGFALAPAGGVDGDRLGDLVLTDRGSLDVVLGRRRPGVVRLAALGPADGFTVDGHLEPDQEGLTAPDPGGLATVGAGGDLSGDERAEVLAGAPLADHGERPDAGSAYVFFPAAR